MKYRTRVCDNPAPVGGGQNCQGRSEETQNCNRHPCAGKVESVVPLEFNSTLLKLFNGV